MRENSNKITHFPAFLEVSNKSVIVFGGGNIATRRVSTLVKFDMEICVCSIDVCTEISDMEKDGLIKVEKAEFCESRIANQFMVLACTNNREVNKKIGEIAKSKNMLVSVCDCKEECNFFFPAVIDVENATVAIAGNGNNHIAVKETADKVRGVLEVL